MAIEMVGGVYCPLSPRDPQHRLHTLIEQTQCRLVFVHALTKSKFNDEGLILNIDSVSINDNTSSGVLLHLLSSIVVTSDNIAYIIFTSGSTGTPKPVRIETDLII